MPPRFLIYSLITFDEARALLLPIDAVGVGVLLKTEKAGRAGGLSGGRTALTLSSLMRGSPFRGGRSVAAAGAGASGRQFLE